MISKSQADRIGGRLRSGQIDAQVLHDLESFRTEFSASYAWVEYILVEQLGYRVTGRPSKSTVAIIEKLKRETIRLTQIQDIAGCRIVVPDILAQDAVWETARVMLSDLVLVDRRAKPINGYRALHLIARVKERPVEIQVRTRLQHAWSEISEKISDAYGQEIKYGKGEEWALEFLATLSRLTAEMELIQSRRNELIANPKKVASGVGHVRSRRKIIEAMAYSERSLMYRIRQLFGELKNR